MYLNYKQLLEKIFSIENDCNLIFEAGGIGFSNYLKEINEIAAYTTAYISVYPSKNKKWVFDIPKQYTSKIDKFRELTIHVEIEDVGNKLHIYGSGDSKLNPFPMSVIDNGQFTNTEDINIKGYSNGSKLYLKTFISILIHELNHKSEELGRADKMELNPMVINAQTAEMLNNCKLSANEHLNQYIKDMFYALFDSSELNAFTASVYGDLLGMKAIKKNFSSDIKETMAYHWYSYLKENLYLITENNDISFWKILKTVIETSAVHYTGRQKTIGEFKNWFINRAIFLLKKFYKKMLNTAGYYYSVQEDQLKGGYSIPRKK